MSPPIVPPCVRWPDAFLGWWRVRGCLSILHLQPALVRAYLMSELGGFTLKALITQRFSPCRGKCDLDVFLKLEALRGACQAFSPDSQAVVVSTSCTHWMNSDDEATNPHWFFLEVIDLWNLNREKSIYLSGSILFMVFECICLRSQLFNHARPQMGNLLWGSGFKNCEYPRIDLFIFFPTKTEKFFGSGVGLWSLESCECRHQFHQLV